MHRASRRKETTVPWYEIALLGIAGGLIPEVMRTIAALRNNAHPTAKELLASALCGILGLGVLLFDNTNAIPIQVAVLGAAFPSLFSGLVAAATKEPNTRSFRRLRDYLAWRF
jgi:hypothetical protein